MREPVALTKVNEVPIPKYERYSLSVLLKASGGTLQCEVGVDKRIMLGHYE